MRNHEWNASGEYCVNCFMRSTWPGAKRQCSAPKIKHQKPKDEVERLRDDIEAVVNEAAK